MNQFPSIDALVQLATGGSGLCAWSGDGKKLIYSFDDGTAYPLYLRDMGAKAPSAPVRLLQDKGTTAAWSADFRSIAIAPGETLSVFDATRADPPLHTITTSVKLAPTSTTKFTWAPVGHRLFYVDATGSHVVDVTGGVPGSIQDVDSSTITWSPTGLSLAGSSNHLDLRLTDVSGVTALTKTVTTPIVTGSSVSAFQFSPDGSKIAFTGVQERAQQDAYVVNVSGAPSVPTRLYPVLPDTAHAHLMNSSTLSPYTTAWSPDGHWLLYSVSDDLALTTDLYAVDVSGVTPGTPLKLKEAYSGTSWSATGDRLFGTLSSNGNTKIRMVDPSTSGSDPLTVYDGVKFDRFAISPSGRVLSYSTKSDIFWIDLAAPQTLAADISLEGDFESPANWRWSPDGNFLAVVENYTSPQRWQPRLIGANGATPSAPLVLQAPSNQIVILAWQPKLGLSL